MLDYFGWAASEIANDGFTDHDRHRLTLDKYHSTRVLASTLEHMISGMSEGHPFLQVLDDGHWMRHHMWNYQIRELLESRPEGLRDIDEHQYLEEEFALRTILLVRDLQHIQTISASQRETVYEFLQGMSSYMDRKDEEKRYFAATGHDLDML